MWTRAELKSKAKENVRQSYWGLVLMSLIMAFITGGGSSGSSSSSSSFDELRNSGSGAGSYDATLITAIVAIMLSIVVVAMIVGILWVTFLTNPLQVGAQRYFVEATYAPKTVNDLKLIGHAFGKGRYMNVVKIMFLRDLYTTLWSLLFVIPGIVKAYEYQMIPYMLAENPDLTAKQAFGLTKQMMDGEKWNAFVLDLSFFGWGLLSVFTCGLLAIFYVSPYIYMTNAHLYEVLKHKGSISYFDPTLTTAAYGYGNPGAYAQTNTYDSSYNNSMDSSYDNSYDNSPYQMPDDKE